MVKLTVLYDQPLDPAAFEKYYLETHVPEHGAKLPNAIKLEANKAVGEQPPYLPDRRYLLRRHGIVAGMSRISDWPGRCRRSRQLRQGPIQGPDHRSPAREAGRHGEGVEATATRLSAPTSPSRRPRCGSGCRSNRHK